MFVSLTFLNFWREMSYQKKLATPRQKIKKSVLRQKIKRLFYFFGAEKIHKSTLGEYKMV